MRPATAAEVTPCAVAARAGSNNAAVASTPYDQTKHFIRTISGMAERERCLGRVKTWRPPERSSIGAKVTFESQPRPPPLPPANPPVIGRHPQHNDQEGEPRLSRVRPQRIAEDEE